MKSRLFIGHDFFGAGNFGDDLMLDGFLRRMAGLTTRPTVVACTPHDVNSQRRRFPSIRWLPSTNARNREEALRECDVWLGLGGTPFQLDSGPWSLDHLERERTLCRRLGKPMLFLGIGCDAPATVWDRRGRRVLEAAERVWTRDARSADLIANVTAGAKIEPGADLAHIALGAVERAPAEPGLLGLLLGLQNPGIVAIEAVEQEIARRSPAKTRWLVQETRSFPSTERWNYSLLSDRARSSVDLMAMNYATDGIEEFLNNFGAPETVVSSRYHGAMIAAWQGCRLAVIARSEKLDGIVADLDAPCVRRIQKADELKGLAQEAAPVQPARLEALRDRSNSMCDSFFKWLGASGAISRSDSGRLAVYHDVQESNSAKVEKPH